MKFISVLDGYSSRDIPVSLQGPYLLKTVPDRVTDDAGAMLSNLILRMNKYQPQQGRWITRTVLNHFGRECFVIRIRQARKLQSMCHCLLLLCKICLMKLVELCGSHRVCSKEIFFLLFCEVGKLRGYGGKVGTDQLALTGTSVSSIFPRGAGLMLRGQPVLLRV